MFYRLVSNKNNYGVRIHFAGTARNRERLKT